MTRCLSLGLSLLAWSLLPGCGGEMPSPAGAASVETGPASVAAAPARAAVRVRVVPVREGRVDGGGEVSGVVHAFRRATVAAEVEGRVVERRVEPGDRVEGGQDLLVLDATRLRLDVEEAKATLAAREVDLAQARSELARGEELRRESTISESQHEALGFEAKRAESRLALARVALRTAQRALDDATVRAPFAGSVEEIHVDVGDYVKAASPVAMLVDLSRARLRAGVTGSEASQLEAGGRASVVFEALGGAPVEGEVRSVGRVADATSGTYRVELWLDNPEGRLREGMVAQVLLIRGDDERYPVVPRSALLRRDGAMSLFVVEGEGVEAHAVARPVRVGRSSRQSVEILEGASVGEQVVVDGLFALRDGSPVLVEASLAAGPPAGR